MATTAISQRRDQIQELASGIAAQFQPEQIILFGSYANGEPEAVSDADLLIVLHHTGRNRTKAIEILRAVLPPFAVDLLVRTPEEMRQRVAEGDLFLRDVVAHGKVLYDAAHR